MNIIRGSRSGSVAELTFTDPACAALRDNKTTQEQKSKHRDKERLEDMLLCQATIKEQMQR